VAVGQYDIIVCGDSFCCAVDIELKPVGTRAHFSQILEDRWGYRVLNLAHGGVSNTCILWQIREAVALAPQTIVYNRTFEDRLDIMLHDDFRPDLGLRNFAYWNGIRPVTRQVMRPASTTTSPRFLAPPGRGWINAQE